MIDDKVLYKSFLEGDINAFEALVIKHKDNLIYFISRYTGGDIYLAEDIAQDVFAHIFVYKESYNDKYSFKTFIYTLGRNKAVDSIRKLSRTKLIDIDESREDPLYEVQTLEDKIIEDEEKRQIIDGMKTLNPDYQRAIYLVAFEELSYKEIAKIMGKTLPQTRVLIHRARKTLKSIIEEGVGRNEE
ncbi:MAG: RNA polymerase sigma factor [Tissierella sp.]|nr:RNA polymerase sigma factor [Tissierella sp.]